MKTLRDQTVWRVKRNEESEDCLPGKYGVITQYGNSDLDIWVKNTRIFARMSRLWKAKQHWDDGGLFVQPYSDLTLAAKFLKCGRRRHMSPETRKKAIARLATMRALAKKPAQKGPLDKQKPKEVTNCPETAINASSAPLIP